MPARNRIICAIDTNSVDEALHLARTIHGNVGMIKLGLEFFLANGPDGVIKVSEVGIPIFLDLKLHDIPTTVSKAILSLPSSCVSFLTVHISGEKEMLQAAAAAALQKNIQLIGVTVLTSIYPELNTVDKVVSMSELALETGINFVVCSPMEVQSIKKLFPKLVTIVPGIRTDDDNKDDHERFSAPKKALEMGADYLVIGRPITQAPNPLSAIESIIQSLN